MATSSAATTAAGTAAKIVVATNKLAVFTSIGVNYSIVPK